MAGRLWCWAREDCWSTKGEPLEERGVEFISAVRPCSPVEWTPERILACPGRQRPLLPQPAFPGYRAFSSLLLPARPCISRVGGTPMTKVHARYAHTRILPNSLSPTYSFPSSLGPIFVSSLRFKFRGKVETRGSFKSATCAGYNIWILKSFFFVAKDFSGCYDRIERIPASKFKHVSSTCIQPYFRKCHVVCQLTSLYLVMQTSSSVFAFNHKNALKDTAYPRELSVDYFYSIFICSLFRK